MIFIFGTILWLLGLITTSFTFVPVLIILVFGIPNTLRLEKGGLLENNNGIIKRYLISLALLTTIFGVTLSIGISFFPESIGFFIGSIMAVIFSLGHLGKTEDNIKDYIETNKRYFKPINKKDLPTELQDRLQKAWIEALQEQKDLEDQAK